MDENASNEQPIKNRKGLSVLFNIFIVFLSIVALAIAGVLIYQKRYLSPFWVNGQSMYPTLNKNAMRADGSLLGVSGGGASDGCTKLDYGVMDTHDRALKNLKRFDIVVCQYDFDDETDKIKRIVGLPGETIKFGQGSENGTLYVKEGNTFKVVEQPIDNEYIFSGYYPPYEISLAKDQYYVLGDNRAHSSDSRTNGAIKYDWLVGKVVALCAYCDVHLTSDGTLEPTNISHYFPKFL